MPQVKAIYSLTLVLSDITIAYVLTMFLVTYAPSMSALGAWGVMGLFVIMSAAVALVTVLSLSFAKPNGAAKKVIASRDLAISLREQALNEHTVVSVSDRNGRIAAVNMNFVKTLGYGAEEVVGQSPCALHWDPDQDSSDIFDTVMRGDIWKGVQQLRTKDGRCLTMEATILPRFDDAGDFENSIAIHTDLSRAKAEGAEEGRNAVVERLPDEVYIYDPESYVLSYANANGRRRLRMKLDQLSGTSLLDLFSQEERGRFLNHIAPILSGEVGTAWLELDETLGHGPVEICTHMDTSGDGKRSLVSVVRDISDRREAEALKISSVATVSHELRTPLTSIKGSLRLIESGVLGTLDPEIGRMINVAYRNSERLLAIVNDILVLERLASGQIALEREVIDLRTLLSQSVEENAAFAVQCDVRFEIQPQEDLALVLGDHDRLMQVMSNLLSNAAKFAPAGSAVGLRLEDTGTTWRVCVSDSGPGIPEEYRQTLFNSFTQVGGVDTKNLPSTGLGLAICREIVSRHGGIIAFETEVGAGSTFFFDLEKHRADASGTGSDTDAVA